MRGRERMLSDCHMHTRYSVDSDAEPEKMIQSAAARGLKTICFTDHEDIGLFNEGKEWVIDTKAYFEELGILKQRYAGQIDVRIGIEMGLQPHLGESIREYIRSYPFDFVIGSVHVIGGKDPYYPDFFEGKSDEEAYARTFEETLEDIRVSSDFDVLGHLDYVVRYGKNREKEYSYEKFSDKIDAVLCCLIEKGKGIELNTAGLKYGLPFAHPCPKILKRYRELGGEIVTVGSDAHRPEHIAYDFDKVNTILKDSGFKYYTEFKERKPIFKEIS